MAKRKLDYGTDVQNIRIRKLAKDRQHNDQKIKGE
jgi:hypothetical protein